MTWPNWNRLISEQRNDVTLCVEKTSEKKLTRNFCIFFSFFFSVFAYVGGLVVFTSTFYRIVMHYFFRLTFLIIGWWRRRRGSQSDDEPNTLESQNTSFSPYDYMNETDDNTSDNHEERLAEPSEMITVSKHSLVDSLT